MLAKRVRNLAGVENMRPKNTVAKYDMAYFKLRVSLTVALR